MEVVDRAIILLYEYKLENDKLKLLEALHLCEKLANVYHKTNERKMIYTVKCSVCNKMFESVYKSSLYCPECFDIRQAKNKKDRYLKQKARGN